MEYNEDELARITSLQFATVIFSGLGDWAVPWRRHGLAAAVDDSAAVPEWVAQPPDCDPTQQPAWSDWHVRYRCEWGLNAADVAVIDTGLRRVRTWQRIGLAVGGALGLAIAAFTMWRKPPITSSSTSSSSSSSVGALLSNTSGAEAVSWRPSHWQWPHYALLSLATSGSASLFRRLATIAAKFAFAQDVWNLPPAVHVSSLAYEMYVRRHSHGRVVYPRLVRQRHPSEAHGGLEVIPDWVRRPWGGDAGEDWPTRLLTEWGMTVDDERVFDGDWWGLTRPVCCLVAGLSLSLIGAMVGIAAASIVQSRSITLRRATADLPYFLPITAAVSSAVLGARYGAVWWTKYSQHQQDIQHLSLDRHSSLLHRRTRFELRMWPARADNDDWIPEWVSQPPPFPSSEWQLWESRLLNEWGVTAEDEAALASVAHRYDVRNVVACVMSASCAAQLCLLVAVLIRMPATAHAPRRVAMVGHITHNKLAAVGLVALSCTAAALVGFARRYMADRVADCDYYYLRLHPQRSAFRRRWLSKYSAYQKYRPAARVSNGAGGAEPESESALLNSTQQMC